MLAQVNGQTILNQFLMSRDIDPRPWIVVEGDDECDILDRHLDHQKFCTVPGYGKQNVANAALLFAGDGLVEAFFLMDSDLDLLLGGRPVPAGPRVAYTSHPDLETDLLFTQPRLWRGLVTSFARNARRPPVSRAEADLMWGLSLDLSRAVGSIRYLSLSGSLGLQTRDLPFEPLHDAMRRGSLLATLRSLVRGKSQVACIVPDVPTIRSAALAHGDALVGGHDLLSALRCAVSQRRGSGVSRRDFRAAFHAAVDCHALSAMPWLKAIEVWAAGLGHSSAFLCAARSPAGGC